MPIAENLQLRRRDGPTVDVIKLVNDWLQDEENGPWLIVFDDANNVEVFNSRAAGQEITTQLALHAASGKTSMASQNVLTPVLPMSRNGTVLITSRHMCVAERLCGSQETIFTVSAMERRRVCWAKWDSKWRSIGWTPAGLRC